MAKVATQIEVRHTEGGKTIVRPIYGRDRSDYVGTWQLPFAITGSALVVGWINLWVRYAGLSYWGYGKSLATKGRMKWPVLLLIMSLYAVDDWGTAIGMQATNADAETENVLFESNPIMVYAWGQLMEYGIVSTETSAMRLIGFLLGASLLVMQYFRWYSGPAALTLLVLAVGKAWVGYHWWSQEPNLYGLKELLTGHPGRRTPERSSLLELVRHQRENMRRRMVEERLPLLTNLFYFMFPFF